MKSFFLVKIVVGVVVLCFVGDNCWSQPALWKANEQPLPGIILLDHNGTVVYYEPRTEELKTRSWPSGGTFPVLLCEISHDTLIIACGSPIYPDTRRYGRWSNVTYYYKFTPKDGATIPIQLIPDSSYHWISLSYDSVTNGFLCVATQNHSSKVFIMRSDFSISRDLTSEVFEVTGSNSTYSAHFVCGGIIVEDKHGCFHIGVGGTAMTPLLLFEGRVLAVSHDKTKVVFRQGDDDREEVHLFDLPNLQRTRLPSSGEASGACFSPDDKYLAVSIVTNNLADDVLLQIYRMSDGTNFTTPIRIAGELWCWTGFAMPEFPRSLWER